MSIILGALLADFQEKDSEAYLVWFSSSASSSSFFLTFLIPVSKEEVVVWSWKERGSENVVG